MATKKRLDEFYMQYGKFITRFEFSCQIIRAEIGRAMGHDISIFEREPAFFDILLEGLTAKPLIDKLYAVYAFAYPDDAYGLPRLKKIRKLFLELIETRNTLSHVALTCGTW